MKKMTHPLWTRLTAMLLALVCAFGLIPTTAFAAGDTIKLKDFGYTGVSYQSAALGRAQLHQMYFQDGSDTTVGFCGTKGGGMGDSLRGQTWGKGQAITDPTVITMMAYFYSHANNKFTDKSHRHGRKQRLERILLLADERLGAGGHLALQAGPPQRSCCSLRRGADGGVQLH